MTYQNVGDKLFYLLIFILFSLGFVVKSSASFIFFLLSILSIFYFVINFKNIKFNSYDYLIIFILNIFLFSLILKQIYYGNFIIKDYDFIIRFSISFFIYIYISRRNLNFDICLKYAIYLSIIFIMFSFIISDNLIFGSRTHTSFVDPNTIGIYIIALFFLLFINNTNLFEKVIFFIIISLALLLVIYSRTRGAWISFILCFPIFYLIKYKFKNFQIFIFILIGLLLFFIFNQSSLERFVSIFSELYGRFFSGNNNSSAGDRITLFLLGIDLLNNNIFFGVNSLDIPLLIENLELTKKYQTHIFDIFNCCGFHNQYMTLLFNYGLLALLGFISLIIFCIYYFLKGNIKKNNINYFFALFSIYISSMALDTLSLKYSQSIFLLILIILLSEIRNSSFNKSNS